MRCYCGQKAVINLRRHRASFCPDHYPQHVENQVERAIRRQTMFGHRHKIMVAVSGGKDSLVLWHLLVKMGYQTIGLHIQLGIGDYSERSFEVTRQFAEDRGLELRTVNVRERYGLGIPDLSELSSRSSCSACGLQKRYVMNREARESGADVIATGHNMDDETAVLLGNVLTWQTDSLSRQHPVMPATEKLVKRCKPLYLLTEKETAAFAMLEKIAYIFEECPNAEGAKSISYKEMLNQLEERSPGIKQVFLQGFMKLDKSGFAKETDKPEVTACIECGEPTTTETCAFCRMWNRARQNNTLATDSSL